MTAGSSALDLLRRGHTAFNQDDHEGMRAIVARWGTTGRFPGIDDCYCGPDGVERWTRDMREVWDSFEVGSTRCSSRERRGSRWWEYLRARGGASGVEVDLRVYALYELRSGLVGVREADPNREALLEAARRRGWPAPG